MPLGKFAKAAARRQSGYVSARPLYEFGGLNEDANGRELAPNQLVKAENCARKDSTLGTRPGPTLGDGDWDAAISGTPVIQGIHEFSYARGTRKLVGVAGGEVYTAHDAVAIDKTATTISSGADNTWTFADFQDKMFAAGGDIDNDGVWYYDGTSALGEIAFTFTKSPRFIFEKWNFLFVGGLSGTTFDDNPLLGRYCDYATDATDVLNWPTTNAIPGQLLDENFGVGSFGSEYNTGYGEFQGKDLDFLLFLTNKRIMAYSPNDNITGSETAFKLRNTIPVGCVHQNAFVNLGSDAGDAVFLNKDGIHSLALSRQYGDMAQNYLSYPIRETFRTLNQTRLDKAWGAYWAQEGMVLFAVSTGSNTTHDLILCMDIKGIQQLTPDSVRWYLWKLNGITANVLAAGRGSDGKPYIYAGTNTGEICRFDRDNYNDLGSTIAVEFQTKDDDFDLPSRDKKAGDAFISVQGLGGGAVTHTLYFDDGKTSGQTSFLELPAAPSDWGAGTTWGTATWGEKNAIRRHRVPGTAGCTTIGHKFQKTAVNNPFFVSLLDQHVKISGPTADSDPNTVG